MRIMSFFLGWRPHVAPSCALKRPAADELGHLLPYNAKLEETAARYCVWRSSHEPDAPLARRAAMAICEATEIKSQEIAAMEADLDAVLAHDRSNDGR